MREGWPLTRREVEVGGGVTVRVLDGVGDGPVLLMPPSPGGHTAWIRRLARELSGQYRVVSWAGGRGGGLEGAVACGEAVLRELEAASWSGVGWLSGFRVVEALSRRRPATALTGLAPLFPAFGAADRRAIRLAAVRRHPRLLLGALGVLGTRRLPSWLLRRGGPVSPTVDPSMVRALIGGTGAEGIERALADMTEALERRWDLPPGGGSALAGGAPLLLVCGQRDWLAPARVCRYALSERPGIEVRELPMASWMLPLEFPDYAGLLIGEHHHRKHL